MVVLRISWWRHNHTSHKGAYRTVCSNKGLLLTVRQGWGGTVVRNGKSTLVPSFEMGCFATIKLPVARFLNRELSLPVQVAPAWFKSSPGICTRTHLLSKAECWQILALVQIVKYCTRSRGRGIGWQRRA